MKQTIRRSIEANIPLLILGKSGWGKSSIIKQTCSEMGLPLVDLRCASLLPEDIMGIPQISEDKRSYSFLPPHWAIENSEKDFVLFLDEINQGTVQVLHAIYRVVLDREISEIKLPRMRIIAAGNKNEENPLLTELMTPLLKRFYVVDWECDHNAACEYLNDKYDVKLQEIYTTPRETEMGLIFWKKFRDKKALEKLGGAQLVSLLEGQNKTKGKKIIEEIEIVKAIIRNGGKIPKSINPEILDAIKNDS